MIKGLLVDYLFYGKLFLFLQKIIIGKQLLANQTLSQIEFIFLLHSKMP